MKLFINQVNNSKKLITLLGLVFLLFCILPITGSLSYAQGKHKNVLVLHSYHKGLQWTDNVTEGIESVLKVDGQNINLQIEYMDTKRILDEQYLQKLYELYKYKFSGRKFDVIISSDNNAFDFLLKYKNILFPDTPVVFCGVNYFKDSILAGHDLVTGVVEQMDVKETLDLALKLHPDAKQFVIINDRTVTGTANKKLLQELIPGYMNSIKFIFLEDLDMWEVQEKVQNLPHNSLVLLMTFNRDKSGNIFSYKESITLIADKCKVPIYSVWDFYLGHGIVGGKLISGYTQGEMAAKIALRLLHGEKITNIPVIKESPNRYMFDYKQMQRYGINVTATL